MIRKATSSHLLLLLFPFLAFLPLSSHCPIDEYAQASWPVTTAGSMAIGQCGEGYSGNPMRFCQADDTWSFQVQNHCVRNRCGPDTSGNATWNGVDSGLYVPGSCLAGYVGNPYRYCRPDGTWDDVVSPCVSEDITCPPMIYARAVWPETVGGFQVAGTCLPGYFGNPYRTCSPGGEWESLVVHLCRRFTCSEETAGGFFWGTTPSLSTARRECVSGTTGEVTRTCDENGNWEAIVDTCSTPGDCPAEVHVRANWPPTAPDSWGVGTCISGWTGTPVRRCLGTGLWESLVHFHCTRV